MALIRTTQTVELESIDLERGDRLRAKRERVSQLAAGVSSPAGSLVFIPLPTVVQIYDTFHPFPLLPGAETGGRTRYRRCTVITMVIIIAIFVTPIVVMQMKAKAGERNTSADDGEWI